MRFLFNLCHRSSFRFSFTSSILTLGRRQLFSHLAISEWSLKRPVYKNLHPISLDEIVEFLNEKQANQLVVIDTGASFIAESLVICDVQSTRALRNLAVEMKSHFNGRPTKFIDNESLQNKTIPGPIVSGLESPDWIAVDFGNVLVHLFLPESRLYYNLEQIWSTSNDGVESEQLEEQEITTLESQLDEIHK